MTERDGIESLGERAEALEDSLGAAAGMASAFDGELRRMREALAATGADIAVLERGLSKGLRRAFDGVVFDGMKLSDALETIARSMIDTTYAAAIKPVTNHLGSLIAGGVGSVVEGLLPFRDGASFAQGRVMPFASGGGVSSPTYFPMRGGTGFPAQPFPDRGADGPGAGARQPKSLRRVRDELSRGPVSRLAELRLGRRAGAAHGCGDARQRV